MVSGTHPDSPLEPAFGAESTADLHPGDSLGPYRLISILQRGGMGEIYLAEHTERTGQHVVIKRLLEDYVADEAYLAMFRDEARIMSQLRHPNIVKVFETPVLEGHLSLVMELVPGRNLAQIIQEHRNQATRMPPNLALHVMIDVLHGLHHAHTARDEAGQSLELVHRDVSPGNLLVSYEGEVKVTDFGIAKSKLSVLATSVGVVKGTTRYLSPEQIRGAAVTAQADLFACAAVLVEMLTGTCLFDRGQVPPTLLAIVKGQRPPISELLPFRAADLCTVLEQALALSPMHRPESAAAMAEALESVRASVGPRVGPGELGAYLTRLFPDRAPSKQLGADGLFGATYLMEAGDAAEGATDRSSVERSMSGSRPLDATEFEASVGPPAAPARRPAFDVSKLPQDSLPPEIRETSAAGSALNLVDQVEAAQREISEAARRPPAVVDSEPGVSDSAAEADAFQVTTTAERPKRFNLGSFLAGAAVGGLVVGVGLQLAGSSAPPPPRIARTAAPPPPAPADPPPRPIEIEPVALVASPPPSATTTTATGAQTASVAEALAAAPSAEADEAQGYVTITRPRRARVTIDGARLRKRVPIRRHAVPAGRVTIKIERRKFSREVEVEVRPGQHLDVSRPEIRVLEEGEPEAQ